MRTLKDVNLKGKKVILRVDFNVPIEGGKIKDTEKVEKTVPTIKYLLSQGSSVIIISHLGRPGGKRQKNLSMRSVAKALEKILNHKVSFVDDIVGEKARRGTSGIKPGEIVFLENLRFNPQEELDDNGFAKKLSNMGDIFVQEAFANAHRPHASMLAITKLLPSYAGLLFAKECGFLSKILENPAKPFVFVAGGKKLETKIELLSKILDKADVILLGGGVANTFLVAEGCEVGKSFYEEDYVSDAERVIRDASDRGVEVLLPEDVVVSKSISGTAKSHEKDIYKVEPSDIIVDIGSKTIAKYAQPLKFAGTIFWNGPMGIAEYESFSSGTKGVSSIIKGSEAVSVVGGGDTIASLSKDEMSQGFSYISTGGGAMMKFLSGEKMPVIEALR